MTHAIVRELPSDFVLRYGSHESFDAGACLMEAVAYVAGEPHSHQPKCTSPVLTRFAVRLNDRIRDDERQLLAPLIPSLVGTRTTVEVDRKRSYALVDASIREIVPMALDSVKWTDLADRMRSLAPVVDVASARAASAACQEIRSEAWKRRSAYAYAAVAAAAADAYAYAYAAVAAAAYAYAYAYAADAAAAYAADAADAASRKPIVEASIRAFRRAIEITE